MGIKILIEECVGETRAVAFAPGGAAFALFLDRSAVAPKMARWGEVHEARLSKLAPEQGGGFAELATGETVFLKGSVLNGRAEGARLTVEIDAEQRRGKVVRAHLTEKQAQERNVFETWRSQLPGGGAAQTENVSPGDAEIASAFDDALSDSVTLSGGGVLRITETPALIAVDVDTAGRRDSGRAYVRALKINQAAGEELARQLALRSLGGAVVLDCVGPLRKETGAKIKQSFLSAFRSFSGRKAEALAPSPFGLMEAAIAWRWTPIAHSVLDDAGQPTQLSELLASLRSLERELARGGAGVYALDLPQELSEIWAAKKPVIEPKLAQRYGARFSITLSGRRAAEVYKT